MRYFRSPFTNNTNSTLAVRLTTNTNTSSSCRRSWRQLIFALFTPVLFIFLSLGLYRLLTAAPAALPAEIIVTASKAYVPKPGTTAYYCGYPHGNYTPLPLGCPTEPLPFSRYFLAAYSPDFLSTMDAANVRIAAYNVSLNHGDRSKSAVLAIRALVFLTSLAWGSISFLTLTQGLLFTPLLAFLFMLYCPWFSYPDAFGYVDALVRIGIRFGLGGEPVPWGAAFAGSPVAIAWIFMHIGTSVFYGSVCYAVISLGLMTHVPFLSFEDVLQYQEDGLTLSYRAWIGFGGSTAPAPWEFPQNPLAHPLFVSQRLPSLQTLSSIFSTAEGRLAINCILSQTPKS